MSGIDWPALLRVGLCGLRLRPDEFWRLTPAELRIMLVGPAGAPLSRVRLEELVRAYPDFGKGQDDG